MQEKPTPEPPTAPSHVRCSPPRRGCGNKVNLLVVYETITGEKHGADKKQRTDEKHVADEKQGAKTETKLLKQKPERPSSNDHPLSGGEHLRNDRTLSDSGVGSDTTNQ